MKISFIVLTWNRYKFLDECLKNLVASVSNLYDFEIIVMDNGSNDKTSKVLEKFKYNTRFTIITLEKNQGIQAYKKLFKKTKGEYTIIIDDDVLSFPEGFDSILIDYMEAYTDYGFIALNVIQNDFTCGAKPDSDLYTEDIRESKIIEKGPTGGWCTCFRKSDYQKIKWRIPFLKISMKFSEDGMLSTLFLKHLKLKSGLIRDSYCFHACGPYYAQKYGHLDREIEKYENSGLADYVEIYSEYL